MACLTDLTVASSSKQMKLLRPLTGAVTSLQPRSGPGRAEAACFGRGNGRVHVGTGGGCRFEAGQAAGGFDGAGMVDAGQTAGGKHLFRQFGRQKVAGEAVVAHLGLGQDEGAGHRGEAGGGHQQVTGKIPFDGAFHGGQGDLFHMLAAVGFGGHPAFEHRDFAFGQGQHQFGILAVFADVGHAGDLEPQVEEIDGRFQAQVVAHGKDRFAARQQTVGARHAMGAAHLHDAGAFVVVEEQGAFDAAGGHDHAVRADLDVAFGEGIAGFAHLEGGDQVVVVGAHHGGVFETRMLAVCFTCRPVPGPVLVQGACRRRRCADPVVEASAQVGAGFQQDHALAGFGGSQGGGHAGGAAADDGDFGLHVQLVVPALHLVIGEMTPRPAALRICFMATGQMAAGLCMVL
jgi:hypothetical protein